ncbi:MAG TPA: tetratricopeptide repeat protein, partial [Aggregatilineales bacterium]|nr:tetratricopeptide repeat protein [Aggregatilineales bacterium]
KLLLRDASVYPYVLLTSSRYGDSGHRLQLQLSPDVPQLIIDLNALTPQAVRAMASQALKGDISDELAAFLAEQADGNPFFVEQLALDLHERHLLREKDGVFGLERRDVEVPDSINTVLIARLDRLGSQVKAVVQMASVLGHEFEVRILSQMLKDDEHLPTKVKQAEAEVIWSALSDVNYLFRHALLRDAAYDMQVTERIRELHGLAGQAMEQLYANELDRYAAHLAFHFARAEDQDRERLYARLAGQRAAAQFANNDAITYLTRALELTGEDQPEECYDLLHLREQVFDRLGIRKSETSDLTALAGLAERLNDDKRRTQTSLGWASYNLATGHYADAIATARQAIEVAQKAGAVEDEAEGCIQWGRALLHQAKYAEGRAHFERALALIGDRSDPRALAIKAGAVRHLGTVAADLSDYPLARKYLEQALALSREIGDRVDEAATLNNLGNVARYEDKYEEARTYLEDALSIRRESGDRRGEEAVLNNLGEVAREEGNLTGARSYLEQSLRISREVEDRSGEGIALETLGKIAEEEGDYLRAQTYLQQSLALSHATGDRRDEDQALDDLGQLSDEEGDYAHAWAYLEQALKLAREIGDRREESQALALLGLVFHHLGNDSAARDYCQDALTIAREVGERAEQASALTLLGHALSGLGSQDEAAQAYQQSLDLRRELGEESLAMECLAGLARCALIGGKDAEALGHVEPILKFLSHEIPQGVHEPLLIYLTCYRALIANNDVRAVDVLKQGHELLEQRAQVFADDGQRKLYLERVAAHRELIAAWVAQQASIEASGLKP